MNRKSDPENKWFAWFTRIKALFDNGWAASLTPTSTNVYLALMKHADHRTWECYPSIDRIASSLGTNRVTVMRAIKQLVDFDLIEYEKGGGRNISNRYKLKETVHKMSLFHAVNSDISGAETVTFPAPKQLQKAHSNRCHRTDANEQQQQPPIAAAEILAELDKAGIASPTAEELADMPGISVALIRKERDAAKERGKGPGAIVLNLRAGARAAAARTAKASLSHPERRTFEDIFAALPAAEQRSRIDAAGSRAKAIHHFGREAAR